MRVAREAPFASRRRRSRTSPSARARGARRCDAEAQRATARAACLNGDDIDPPAEATCADATPGTKPSRHASPSSTRYVTTARDGRATPFPECLRTTRAEAGNPIHAYRGLPALGAVRVRTAPFQKFLLVVAVDRSQKRRLRSLPDENAFGLVRVGLVTAVESLHRARALPRPPPMVSGDAAHVASRDALRADLAETKLLVHDLTKQLQEANARISAGAGAKSVDEAVTKAMDTQRAQRDTIDRLTKEVNGLLQKNRLIEAHVDALTDQERELRRTFDAFVFWIVLGVLGLGFGSPPPSSSASSTEPDFALVARRVERWRAAEL